MKSVTRASNTNKKRTALSSLLGNHVTNLLLIPKASWVLLLQFILPSYLHIVQQNWKKNKSVRHLHYFIGRNSASDNIAHANSGINRTYRWRVKKIIIVQNILEFRIDKGHRIKYNIIFKGKNIFLYIYI